MMRSADAEHTTESPNRVTQLLLAWRAGHEGALDELVSLVYDELRKLAHSYVRGEGPAGALQTTELVNEAYLRLVNVEVDWRDRQHFFALAARQMRRILIDLARRRQAFKRWGDLVRVDLDDFPVSSLSGSGDTAMDLLAFDEVLRSLEAFDPRKSQILELRFFAGLTIRETSELLKLSHATVERDYKLAKAWLGNRLSGPAEDDRGLESVGRSPRGQ